MRGELNRVERDGRVAFELSNSAGKFWEFLKTKNIHESNYKLQPEAVGAALVEVVEGWHEAASHLRGGNVNLAASSFLVLSWNRKGWYQLFQFRLSLPDPRKLHWHFPATQRTRSLRGEDAEGTVIEWYGESGGQLKYYPLARKAVWASDRFQLEPLGKIQHGILAKVAAYFPDQWAKVSAK
jgi:hypothetical protein